MIKLISSILYKNFHRQLSCEHLKSINRYKDIFSVNMLRLMFLGLFLIKSLKTM